MPNFISPSALLRKKYEERKSEIVRCAPTPVSDICLSCWYRPMCMVRTLMRQPPRTCCVYDLFGAQGKEAVTLEECVAFTCDVKCKERRTWPYDPCPHDETYCDQHCPVSRHILGIPPNSYDFPEGTY